MPTQSIDLFDFLNEIELTQYLEPIRLQLGVTSFDQLKYVKKEDLLGIGMPMPLTRLLLDKYRKKAGYPKIPFTSKRMKVKTPSIMNGSAPQPPKSNVPQSPFGMPQTRHSFACGERTSASVFRGTGDVGRNNGSLLSTMSMEPILLCDDDLTNFELIGQGHFAKVYKAMLRKQTRVAVKELKQGGNPGSIESLMKEVRVMLSVRHANIIHFYGIVLGKVMRSSPTIRLVFEYANLGSLDSYLRNKKPKLTVQMLWMFCQQILLGLAFLHERRLLHRDIAARNILVFDSESVKLADFGLSKFLPDESYESYTAETAIMPVAWSAPESLKYKRYSAASDVYMFGVTCWEIFSFADHPRPRLTANEMLMKLENGEVLSQPEFCTDSIYNLILSCCSFNAAERPDTQGLVMQWGNSRPKMLTSLKSCAVAGKLHFEKGDQLFVLSEPCDTDSCPWMKGQNKRTFGVGSFHFSLVHNDGPKSKQSNNKSSNGHGISSSASSSAQPSPNLNKPREIVSGGGGVSSAIGAVAAKSVLVHVPVTRLSMNESSAWDYRLYSEDSAASTIVPPDSPETDDYAKLSEVRSKLAGSKQTLEHTNDLIDLTAVRSPEVEHQASFSPATEVATPSNNPFGEEPGLRVDNWSCNFTTHFSQVGTGDHKSNAAVGGGNEGDADDFSLYDDQSEFYSVVDSDEGRLTPSNQCECPPGVNNATANQPGSSNQSRPASTNPFYTNGDDHEYSSLAKYTQSETIESERQQKARCSNGAQEAFYDSNASNWVPINVQEQVDTQFDAMPNVQYSEEANLSATASDINYCTVTNIDSINLLGGVSQSQERDLIDLNTLKFLDCDVSNNAVLCAANESAKSPIAKSMQLGGSRYSLDLEAVKLDQSLSTEQITANEGTAQVDYCDELEDRIKKLRELQLHNSMRSSETVNNISPRLALRHSVKAREAVSSKMDRTSHNSCQSSASRSTSDIAESILISKPPPPIPARNESSVIVTKPAVIPAFEKSSVGMTPPINMAATFQSSTPIKKGSNKKNNLMPGVSAADHSAIIGGAPTAPSYELVSASQLKSLEAQSDVAVQRVCSSVNGSTQEQCYNALVETNWDERRAIEAVKVNILQNTCTLSADNCRMVLKSFKYDLAKASKFVQDFNCRNLSVDNL